MTLDDLFAELSYGELSNLALSNNGDGTIVDAKKPQLLHFTNEALIDLHTKFNLKEDSLMLRTVEGKTQYFLKSAYSTTGFDELVADWPYIEDTVEKPFKEDVLKVLSVDSSNGYSRSVNNYEDIFSIYTPKPLEIQVPFFTENEVLAVHYQALPDRVGLGEGMNQEFNLPLTLHSALKAYVAYKVYSTMNTAESMNASQMHLVNYAGLCAQAVDRDSLNLSVSNTNSKFRNNGWI